MSTRWKRGLLCGAGAFVLAFAVLLWRGPVWILDLEDNLIAFAGAVLLVILIAALAAWEAARAILQFLVEIEKEKGR